MRFRFKTKRTTKSVGRDIGKKLAQIEKEEKVVRTLEKEEEVRLKQEAVRKRIAELKARKPTAFKKFMSGARKTGKVIGATAKSLQKRKAPVKRRTVRKIIYRKPLRRKSKKLMRRNYRRTPVRRRTTTRREVAPRQEQIGILPRGSGIYG